MPMIEDLFHVTKGRGGYIKDLGGGDTPLVSATSRDNGITALVDDAPEFKAPAVTVERVTGQAFVQLADFSTVPDDLSVLIPKRKMDLDKLYILASFINNSRWRFSFARKLTPTRLKRLVVPDVTGKSFQVVDMKNLLKSQQGKGSIIEHSLQFKSFNITELFRLIRGDFHALSRLKEGNTPTVSRVSYDSGIAGYFAKPPKAKLYQPLTITISTVTGDAFVQLQPFIATDNVLILLPKTQYAVTTLFFMQALLNREKWRCTYGRQLYKAKFRKTEIMLPVTAKGELDEEYMKSVVSNAPYWNLLESYIKSLPHFDIDMNLQPEMEFVAENSPATFEATH